jgi:hypothetical protein
LPDDFADWLSTRDLVVEGQLLDVEPGVRRTRYRVRVTRVLQGVAEDSVLTVSDLGHGADELRSLGGAHVLAYGIRMGFEGWHLGGGVILIRTDGSLAEENGFGFGDVGWLKDVQSHQLTYEPLLNRLVALRPQSATGALEVADGIAIVRLDALEDSSRQTRFSYTCDSLGWARPTVGRVPRRIVFDGLRSCFGGFYSDSVMILPLRRGARGDSVVVSACPHGWVIESGIVRGLGVPLAEIDRALEVRNGRIHVRKFLAPKAVAPSPR